MNSSKLMHASGLEEPVKCMNVNKCKAAGISVKLSKFSWRPETVVMVFQPVLRLLDSSPPE